MKAAFVHLRNHSEFSLTDGLLRVKKLVAQVADNGMPAVAITDRTNLYALVKFQKAAFAAGVKPVFGTDLQWLDADDPSQVYTLTLLAQNLRGYKNLLKLVSRAYTHGQSTRGTFVQREWISEHADGLLALSGGVEGDIGQALLGSSPQLAEVAAERWRKVFGDRYYLDLQRLGRVDDERYVHAAVELAERLAMPVVATNSCCFTRQGDFEAHEVRVCINDGRALDDPRRPRKHTEQQYVKTAEQMLDLFSDIPEALANSVAIAERCSVQVELGRYYLPEYPIPAGETTESFFVRFRTRAWRCAWRNCSILRPTTLRRPVKDTASDWILRSIPFCKWASPAIS